MRSDLDAYREAVADPIGVHPGGDVRIYTTGILLDLDTGANRALVSVNGSAGSWLPVLQGIYAGVRTVHVLLSPLEGGRAQLVLGPAEIAPADPDEDPLPQPPPPPVEDERTDRVVLTPQWTGTWNTARGAWPTRMGAPGTDLTGLTQGVPTWQTGAPLADIGLAVYGRQVMNLGATRILTATLRAGRIDTGAHHAALVVQGAPHTGPRPSGGPAPTGPTATSGPVTPAVRAPGQTAPGVSWTSLELPPQMAEALRTGAARALAAVGPDHSVWGGTGTSGAFALDLTYTRPS